MVFEAVLAFLKAAEQKSHFLEEFSIIHQNTVLGQESL